MADTYRFFKHNNIANISQSDHICIFLTARINFIVAKVHTHAK